MRKWHIIIPVLTFASCYHNEEIEKAIVIRNAKEMKYEMEIPIYFEGRGNVHQLDPSSYEFSDSYWIYTNTKSGFLEADSFVFTKTRNKINTPYRQSNLKVYLEFENDSVIFNLVFPLYKDSDSIPEGWEKWSLNGKYRLRHFR